MLTGARASVPVAQRSVAQPRAARFARSARRGRPIRDQRLSRFAGKERSDCYDQGRVEADGAAGVGHGQGGGAPGSQERHGVADNTPTRRAGPHLKPV
jgi:hypothetical protein